MFEVLNYPESVSVHLSKDCVPFFCIFELKDNGIVGKGPFCGGSGDGMLRVCHQSPFSDNFAGSVEQIYTQNPV